MNPWCYLLRLTTDSRSSLYKPPNPNSTKQKSRPQIPNKIESNSSVHESKGSGTDYRMDTQLSSRQSTKRNSMDDNLPKSNLNIDLNTPISVVESCQPGPASPAPQRRTMKRAANPAVPQWMEQQQAPCSGLSTSPIDVELIEEEVEFVTSIERSPPARTYSRRSRLVIIDVDSDNHLHREGLSVELPLSSVDRNMWHQGIPAGQTVIDCDALSSEENTQRKRAKISFPEPPPPEVPKEPNFICPVCMNTLDQAASTICGHIFCQICIKTSIQVQKKCPTCRKKLTPKNFHRIYLPTRN